MSALFERADIAGASPEKPAEFATFAIVRAAEDASERVAARHVLVGTLNAFLSFGFFAGLSADDAARMLRLWANNAEGAFEAMRKRRAN